MAKGAVRFDALCGSSGGEPVPTVVEPDGTHRCLLCYRRMMRD